MKEKSNWINPVCMELGGTVSKLEDVTASHATIAKMEQLSEDLEADKHQLIELDRKHHQNREMLKQVFHSLQLP